MIATVSLPAGSPAGWRSCAGSRGVNRREHTTHSPFLRPLLLQGFLSPRYHKFYWLGLTTSNWPQFINIDPLAQNLSLPDSYKHWGTPRDSGREPNNVFAPENCGGGNASTTFLNGWGWADYMCDTPFTYMCR